MNLLSYLYRQSSPLLLLASLLGIVGGLSGAALVAVISKGITGDPSQLTLLAGAFFGLCLLHVVAKTSSEIALLRLTQDAILNLRIELSRKLLATPQKRLQELGKPGLLAILTKDIDSFTLAFQWLPVAFGNVIIICACFAYLAWLSWQLFIMLLIFLLVGLFSFHFAERRPLEQLNQVREQIDTLYLHFRDLIEGSKELQLNRQRGVLFVERVIGGEARGFRASFVHSLTGYSWVLNLGMILFYLVIGLLLFVTPLWLPQPIEKLTAATLTLLYLIRPISDIVVALPALRQAGIALEKIQQLDRDLGPGELRQLPTSDPFAVGSHTWSLELCGISHHYPGSSDDSQFMFGPLDLDIRQGEILYIIGGNGSGKTTLAMLILGLFAPETGSIKLNGVAVEPANIDCYRQHFSAVFADFHLFEQLLDSDQPTLTERASHYVKVLGMEHKVKIVDGKFSTINLSTGQRKRLALVSAYLEDRPIYLFDEWAADQDPLFKRVFYTELLPELKARGKTVLIITHDDAYFSHADRIIKLEDGHLKPISA